MSESSILFSLLVLLVFVSAFGFCIALFIRRILQNRKSSKLQGQVIYSKAFTSKQYTAEGLARLAAALELSRGEIREAARPEFILTLIFQKVISEEGGVRRDALIEKCFVEYAKSGLKLKDFETFFEQLRKSKARERLKASLFQLKKDMDAERYQKATSDLDAFFREPDYVSYLRQKLRECQTRYQVMGYRM